MYIMNNFNNKTVNLYESAIKNNDLEAMYFLARSYQYGKVTPVDGKKAIELYSKAADLGHVKSMTKAADLLYYDYHNKEKALKYWLCAASHMDLEAIDKLSEYYFKNKEYVPAITFAKMALKLDSKRARRILDEIYNDESCPDILQILEKTKGDFDEEQFFAMGKYYYKENNVNASLNYFNVYAQEYNQYVRVAKFFVSLKNYEEACKWFNLAVEDKNGDK